VTLFEKNMDVEQPDMFTDEPDPDFSHLKPEDMLFMSKKPDEIDRIGIRFKNLDMTVYKDGGISISSNRDNPPKTNFIYDDGRILFSGNDIILPSWLKLRIRQVFRNSGVKYAQ